MTELFPTRIESLSNDVWIEIFDYLDGYSLCSAFFGLNRRLDGLFRTAPMHLEFDKTKTNEHVWETLDSVIHPLQIRSLTFSQVEKIDDRFVTSTNVNLVSLIVKNIDHSVLKNLLQKLPKGASVKNLVVSGIRDGHRPDPSSSILATLLQKNGRRASSMVNAVLNFNYFTVDFSTVRTSFPVLRCLSLSIISVSVGLLRFLQVNTPNLRSLKLCTWAQLQLDSFESDLRLPQLVELDLNYTNDYSPVSRLLPVFPSLTKLHLDWRRRHRSRPALDGSQWQTILVQCLPNLRRFTLHFVDIGLAYSVLQSFYQNEFWAAKKVHVRMTMDSSRSRAPEVKTIYFGRQWCFSHFDHTALELCVSNE